MRTGCIGDSCSGSSLTLLFVYLLPHSITWRDELIYFYAVPGFIYIHTS